MFGEFKFKSITINQHNPPETIIKIDNFNLQKNKLLDS
jgi:hypothetical protein